MKTLNQKITAMSPARRKKIARRAAQLIAEEMTLRELRRAHKLTQGRIAETLGIGQDQVSRLEQRSDLLLSTLRSYVEAMGGRLTIIAEFPHRNPVLLSGFASLDREETPVAARGQHANVKVPTQAKSA
jgi:transcriptional regulator with XRE-family HTH domain